MSPKDSKNVVEGALKNVQRSVVKELIRSQNLLKGVMKAKPKQEERKTVNLFERERMLIERTPDKNGGSEGLVLEPETSNHKEAGLELFVKPKPQDSIIEGKMSKIEKTIKLNGKEAANVKIEESKEKDSNNKDIKDQDVNKDKTGKISKIEPDSKQDNITEKIVENKAKIESEKLILLNKKKRSMRRRRRRREKETQKIQIQDMPDCKLSLEINNDSRNWENSNILIFKTESEKLEFLTRKSFEIIINEQISKNGETSQEQKCVFCGKSDFMVISKNAKFFHLFCLISSQNLKTFFGFAQNSFLSLIVYVKILRVVFEKIIRKRYPEMTAQKPNTTNMGSKPCFEPALVPNLGIKVRDVLSLSANDICATNGIKEEKSEREENLLLRNQQISQVLLKNESLRIEILMICEKIFYQIFLKFKCELCKDSLSKGNTCSQ